MTVDRFRGQRQMWRAHHAVWVMQANKAGTLAADELGHALVPLLHAQTTQVAAVAFSFDDISSAVFDLWPRIASRRILPVVGDAFDAAVGITGTQLAASLERAVRRYGAEAVQGLVDAARQAFMESATLRVGGVSSAFEDVARASLAEGFAAGESIRQLTARLTSFGPWPGGTRFGRADATRVARTNVIGASNAGSLAQARAMGAESVQQKVWIATGDNRTRPDHADADGQTVPLNDTFSVGGEGLDFPGDGSDAQASMCRCAVGFEDISEPLAVVAAVDKGGGAMPYDIAQRGEQWCVTKTDDGSDMGCFPSEADALDAVSALYAGDADAAREAEPATASALGEWVTVTRGDVVISGNAESLARFGVFDHVGAAPVAAACGCGAEVDTAASTPERDAVLARPPEWQSVLVVEGVKSGDGRIFDAGSLTWRDLPLPFKASHADDAPVVGAVTALERVGNELTSFGVWARDENGVMTGPAHDAYEAVRGGMQTGVSVEVDDVNDSDVELVWPDGADDDPMAMPESVIFHQARIMAVAHTPTPAYPEAFITLLDTADPMVSGGPEEMPMEGPMAAAAHLVSIPDVPPAEWFDEPSAELLAAGQFTITDEGRVYGFAAPGGTAHRGLPGRVTAPLGVDYSRFHLGETPVDGGGRVVTGNLTMACGHRNASQILAEQFDNSCSVFATVRVGERGGNVWVAGALLPGASPDQIRRAMACQLSGEWGPRVDGGAGRELKALLLVPVPGFAKARRSATTRMYDGELVASAVPVRFGSTRTHDPAAAGIAERIARTVGLDHATRRDRIKERVLA